MEEEREKDLASRYRDRVRGSGGKHAVHVYQTICNHVGVGLVTKKRNTNNNYIRYKQLVPSPEKMCQYHWEVSGKN